MELNKVQNDSFFEVNTCFVLLSKCFNTTQFGIVGLGEKKSRQLLGKFDSIQKISCASRDELTGVLGASLARAVEDCFRRKIVMKKSF